MKQSDQMGFFLTDMSSYLSMCSYTLQDLLLELSKFFFKKKKVIQVFIFSVHSTLPFNSLWAVNY